MKQQKDLDMPIYYDFYGCFLTEKQGRVTDMYYNEDLSLAEIATEFKITRQAVMDILSRARKKLYSMEDKLGLVAQQKRTVIG